MTEKQKLFCLEYIKSKNATRSAAKAGYSKKTAGSQGERLLKNVEIKKFIAQKLQKQAEKIELTGEMVLEELRNIAFSSPADFVDSKDQMLHLKKLPRSIAAALASFEIEQRKLGKATITNKKFKLHNKVAALEMLGKHFGIFETDNLQKQVVVRVGYNEDEEDE